MGGFHSATCPAQQLRVRGRQTNPAGGSCLQAAGSSMSQLFVLPFIRATVSTGAIAPGAKLYFYRTGTTTLTTVYADNARNTRLSNPVPANAFGAFPDIFLDPAVAYRVRLTTSAGVLIDEADPVYGQDPGISEIDADVAENSRQIEILDDRLDVVEADIAGTINQLGEALTAGTISLLIGTRIYASRALLDADLTPADNLYALVVGDPTAANNDLYQKNGATGTGSWDGPLGAFAAASALALQYANEAEASASALTDAIRSLSVYAYGVGYPNTPTTGTSAAANTFVFADPMPADGIIGRIRARGGSVGGTIKVKRYTRSGSLNTQVGSDIDVAITASSDNSIEVSIPFNAGDLIGFYTPVSTIFYTVATGDSGGYYEAAGNVSNFTDASASTTARLQIGFDILDQVVTGEEFQQMQEDIASLDDLRTVINGLQEIETIGRDGTPVTGTNTAEGTYVFANPFQNDGTITGVRAFGGALGGTLKVRIFDAAGSVLTQSGSDTSVAVTANQPLSATVSIPVTAGQFVGYYTPAQGIKFTVQTADGLGWWQAPSADSTGFTHGAAITTARLQIGFDNSYLPPDALSNLRDSVDNIEIALKTAGINLVPIYLVVDGNSLSATPGENGVTSWPVPLGDYLGITVVNLAVSGQTTSTMAGDIASQLAAPVAAAAAAGARLAIIGWEGFNSMRNQGRTPTQAVNDLETWANNARAAAPNAMILVANLPNMGGYNGNWVNGVTQPAYNSLLASRYTDFADVLIDMSSDPRLQVNTNTTYYQVDTVHLTNAGQLVADELMRVGLREITQAIL